MKRFKYIRTSLDYHKNGQAVSSLEEVSAFNELDFYLMLINMNKLHFGVAQYVPVDADFNDGAYGRISKLFRTGAPEQERTSVPDTECVSRGEGGDTDRPSGSRTTHHEKSHYDWFDPL